jgi:molybdopterin biosynthesis enzyme
MSLFFTTKVAIILTGNELQQPGTITKFTKRIGAFNRSF